MQERGRNYHHRKKGYNLYGKKGQKPKPLNDKSSKKRDAKNFVELRDKRISDNKLKLDPRKKENKKGINTIHSDRISKNKNSIESNIYKNKIKRSKDYTRSDNVKVSSLHPPKKSLSKFNAGKIIEPLSVQQNPKFLSFTLALLFAVLLVLLSSVDSVLTEGVFLLYLGILLYRTPKLPSRGLFLDLSAATLILYTLGAFLFKFPNFYPEWRVTAFENYEIDFGIFNSVVPLKSLESWFILSGCACLFYYMGNWKINLSGIRWISVFFLFLVTLVGLITIQYGYNPLRLFTSSQNLFIPTRDYSSNIAILYLFSGIVSLGLLTSTGQG